ncbi:hypothetical protein [Poseidonibacter ostreae]|jgi:hypothetical protein|uniref:Uncharacterized protein n=1 Tax=Poseidonibacter ostreae TaxID=2654171 RepID=A0A6L4WRU5_9BACT|nr:hypothetical protein [Poseidonibacter ostreae]KAB7885526.1 hypothetical protein GA417_08240 [Poseidonibacter ostreae]KAB7888495.1 hypothetical protein GBG19_08910 [Poseidonibacter ostreae]
MNLEQIQEKIISDFDFEKVMNILEKLNEEYEKEDLINNVKGLVKMAYLSREMEDVSFSSGHFIINRSYYEGEEVQYDLSFLLEVNANLNYELEKPFETKNINEKEALLKKKLEELLLININANKEENDNYIYEANIQRIERMIEILD